MCCGGQSCRPNQTRIETDHWQRFGRHYYTRHDYEAVDADQANALMDALKEALPDLPGRSFSGLTVTGADEFSYTDPVDGSVSTGQGLRIGFEGGGRVILRLSGTGTEGATLRVYLERYAAPGQNLNQEPQTALADIIAAFRVFSDITARTGRTAPDVMT